MYKIFLLKLSIKLSVHDDKIEINVVIVTNIRYGYEIQKAKKKYKSMHFDKI